MKYIYILIGILNASLISYPSPPYYILPFISYILLFVLIIYKKNIKAKPIMIIYVLLIVWNLIVVLSYGRIEISSLLSSLIFIELFLGFFLESKEVIYIYKGTRLLAIIYSLIIIFSYFILQKYEVGINIFIYSSQRLWLFHLMPDWPNGISAMLGFSLFLKKDFKINFNDIFLMIGIILTTSRSGLIFIIYFLIYLIFVSKLKKCNKIILFLSTLTILIIIIINLDQVMIDRMLKLNDRYNLYSFLIDKISERPLLGYGNLLPGKVFINIPYQSAHNFYLDLLFRGGIINLFLFLLPLLFINIRKKMKYFKHKKPILYNSINGVMVLMVSSVFQNYLKYPSFMFLYSISLFSYVVNDYDKSSINYD